MSAAVWVPWLAAFVLESFGAYLAFRKRLHVVFLLLSFGALADVSCAIARIFFGPNAQGNAAWIQSMGEYMLLCWMACVVCGKMMDEKRQSDIVQACMLFSITGALVAGTIFSNATTLKDKLLDAEIAADMLLLIIVTVGWLSRRGHLKSPWTWIAAGFLVHVGWDVACTFLWQKWPIAQMLYPIGEISALALWSWASLAKLHEVRIGIGQRIMEAEKVSVC